MNIDKREFRSEVFAILSDCIGRDYTHYLIESKDEHGVDFLSEILKDVEETSAWQDAGYYTDDDIRLAIGRVLLKALNIIYD